MRGRLARPSLPQDGMVAPQVVGHRLPQPPRMVWSPSPCGVVWWWLSLVWVLFVFDFPCSADPLAFTHFLPLVQNHLQGSCCQLSAGKCSSGE